MAKFLTPAGALTEVELPPHIYSQADSAGMAVPAFLNSQYPTDPTKYGTTFDQMVASVGLVVPSAGHHAAFGTRAPSMKDVFEGKAGFNAASNVQGFGSPIGQQARTLFPIALVMMGSMLLRCRWMEQSKQGPSYVVRRRRAMMRTYNSHNNKQERRLINKQQQHSNNNERLSGLSG